MTQFVDQICLYENGEVGDCFRAALASVLGLPLDDVPHFALLGKKHFTTCYTAWLEANGYDISISKDDGDEKDLLPLCIASGLSPRNPDSYHAVVADAETGKVLHDPHPSRVGLPEIDHYLYIFNTRKERHEQKATDAQSRNCLSPVCPK